MREEHKAAFDRYKHLLTTYPYDRVVSFKVVEETQETVTLLYKLEKNERIELCYTRMSMEEVRAMYQNGQSVCLDGCYVDNFDATQLVDAEGEMPHFLEFSAECAFFFGHTEFSGAQFLGEAVSFWGSAFEGGEVFFEHCKFSAPAVSFEKVNCGHWKVSFMASEFVGGVSFMGMEYGDGGVCFDRARFGEGEVSFRESCFGTGDVSFVETDFGGGDILFDNAKFGEGEIWFGRAVFGKGKVLFEKTNFGDGNVTFWETDFGEGPASFNKATFGKGEVSFCGTSFGNDYVWFDDVDFGAGSVSFMGTNFGESDVRFYRTNFQEGDATFYGSTFGESEVRFWRCSFGDGEVNFTGVIAPKTTVRFRGCKLLNHEIFRFSQVKRLEVIDCIVDGVLLMNSEKQETVQIDELSFLNTKNLGSIFIDWETAKAAIENYPGKESEKEEEVSRKKAKQMQMLKENFHNLGEYDYEDEAFAEYMNYRRKTNPFVLRFPSWVLSAISGYGTKPVRLFITMLVVIFFFGFLFSEILPVVEMVGKEDFGDSFNGMARGLYFSMITFMTIGYGDISPANAFTSILAGLEGFAGLFLMSYFTVAVVRKTLR